METQKSSCSCGAEGKNRIIYSCSGIGSNVGQLANAAACRLASEGYGGGSCLAGVGGGIEKLVGMGKTADERIVIDGCPVACTKKIMDDKGLLIDHYVLITDLGITKTPGPAYAESDVQTIVNAVKKA
ncbi:MAG: putative zinc-binding protein [Methanoregula sp.]|nr:putative zinc-binding protein [Methanoregula sp.]